MAPRVHVADRPESDFSDNCSDGTISIGNSVERVKLPDGCVEERLRVDRRKLEAMVLGCPSTPWDIENLKLPIGPNGRILSADDFFLKIMEETSVEIRYPRFLKVGARNKKDPHVRVLGPAHAVSEATALIKLELEPQRKITMKMDVPWTCHSHIIGKGGNTIQPVVKRTGVSIHFPDGNKNSEVRKSNQVSINSRGEELSGLEEARVAVRELTPLIFKFNLPATVEFITAVPNPNLLVMQVQNKYKVQAELKIQDEGTPSIVGSVRGSEWDATRVKEATLKLLETLCGNLASQMPVQMSIEVSPQHYAFILGRNNDNLRKIMQRTSTKINFPDQNDPSIPLLQRSVVNISGAIDNVYLARQNIIGLLPIVLMFDLQPEQHLSTDSLGQIMLALDVYIIAKNKRLDERRPVVIKGAERNASNIYEAWRLVTQSDKPVPKAKIPSSYFLPDATPLIGYDRNASELAMEACSVAAHVPASVTAEVNYPHLSYDCMYKASWCPSYGPLHYQSCDSQCMGNFYPDQPVAQANMKPYLTSGGLSDALVTMNDFSVEEPPSADANVLAYDRRAPGCEKKLEKVAQSWLTDYTAKKLLASKVMKQPVEPVPRTPTSSWSGYGFSKSMPAYMMQNMLHDRSKVTFSENSVEFGYSSCESKLFPKTSLQGSDGSSLSSSGCSVNSLETSVGSRDDNFYNKASSSNIFECLLPTPSLFNDAAKPDMTSLLSYLNLEMYIGLFASQDVDIDTFVTLSDSDLKELGIKTFGHRKKLLTASRNLGAQMGRNSCVQMCI